MNMDSELKQTESIAPEDYYEEEDQDEIVNDNIATLEKEDATPETPCLLNKQTQCLHQQHREKGEKQQLPKENSP